MPVPVHERAPHLGVLNASSENAFPLAPLRPGVLALNFYLTKEEYKMSPCTSEITTTGTLDSNCKGLYTAAAVAALVQLGCVLMTLIVVSFLGGEPSTPDEYFTALQEDRLAGILRLDLASMINVSLFSVTIFAVYAALRRDKIYAALATALVFVGVALALSTHSAFSMIHLSDEYAAATAAQREQLTAAAQAVIATDWWHSTGGFMAGLFLQGGTAFISVLMLRGKRFSQWTAYAGLLSNGLDFVHVLVGLVAPDVGNFLLAVGGMFYVLWYPLLGWDFYRLRRRAARPGD